VSSGENAAQGSSGRVLIVSNRLPITLQRGPQGLEQRASSGGLVSAMEPVLARRGGTWIGWPGLRLRPDETLAIPDSRYDIRPVELSRTDVNRYYHGFSNRTLWPLLHCFPSRALFDRSDWEAYDRVNERFAQHAAEECTARDRASNGDGDELVWIHDYQLMTSPLHLRRLVPAARIAYFLHIPFPPYDVFRLLPWSREVLRGMLAADLIGFHVPGYAQNFVDCAERLLAARVDPASGLIEHGDRTVEVGAFPIGIDFEHFESLAREAEEEPAGTGAGAGTAPGERIILGVDRLDYTKGIVERLLALERLFELHPEHRERVVLLQVAVPSRFQVEEYRELKREIDELVGRVNGRFATSTWSPIRYLYRSVSPSRLASLYRNADVALVTPVRDGMNLVAKEFVASQIDEPGVLVLSRLAGAAETMREALLVNPANIDGVADSLHRALLMEEPERRSRMVALRRREQKHNVYAWVDSFLDAAEHSRSKLHPASDPEFESWLGAFIGTRRLALFLDYDGTLTRLRRHPSEAVLSPEMREALEACAARDDTDVTIVTGRALEDVREMVDIAGLAFAGNHGLEISGGGLEPFRHEDLVHYRDRLSELSSALGATCRGGAWVEEKGASLTLHFREVDLAQHERIISEARELIQAAGFQARDAHCAVEARPPIGWDKGHAVLHVLRLRYGPAWSANVRAIYAGDDHTDEDAFRVLSGLGVTFRVGGAEYSTAASRTLSDVSAVQALVRWLAKRPFAGSMT